MKALRLTTRYRDGLYEADACLLIYDEPTLLSATVSADVRDVLNHRPNTAWIYVLSPFQEEQPTLNAVLFGSGVDRSNGLISVIHYKTLLDGDRVGIFSNSLDETGGLDQRPLAPELVHGWLFDLFDRYQGLIEAAPGVHFGKASGKHSEKFLRASNTMLSTAACGAVAFFALATIPVLQVRRIFIDTSPIISIAFAMHRIAARNAFWTYSPSVQSFSSYGGLDNLPTLNRYDLVLISASTSGSLAARLIELGMKNDLLITLYFLASKQGATSKGAVVCDLTWRPDRPFGYPLIENQPHSDCRWCKNEYVLAQLEGDQFLLEKRGIKRLRVSKASQKDDALEVMELLARNNYLSVSLYRDDLHHSNIKIDVERTLAECPLISAKVIRLLKRFTPTPLALIVLVNLSNESFDSLVEKAGMAEHLENVPRIQSESLEKMSGTAGRNVLVMVGCLSDHALLRGINAQLRVKAPKGCIAYLSAFTIADSEKNLSDLRMFLSYGEFGAETFIFRSAFNVMLPWLPDRPSAWDDELDLLKRLDVETLMAPALKDRFNLLLQSSAATEKLFLRGNFGELKIAADFVYLATENQLEKISQADVYAVVSNLMATVRCNDVGLSAVGSKNLAPPLTWKQTVYGQVLLSPACLCPRNLRDYNDAILRAAFLRMAHRQELNFSVDDDLSSEVCDVILADMSGWAEGRGESLPEFIMALACGRLKLTHAHANKVIEKALSLNLPLELEQLLSAISKE